MFFFFFFFFFFFCRAFFQVLTIQVLLGTVEPHHSGQGQNIFVERKLRPLELVHNLYSFLHSPQKVYYFVAMHGMAYYYYI